MAERSRQIFISERDRKKKLAGIILITALLVACAAVLIYSLTVRYSPPALDKNRQTGVPIVEGSYLYKQLESDFGYSFSMAANLYRQEDGTVNVYFTNPEDNQVSLMCEILDAATGDSLYKSGRIEPGEYVEKLKPSKDFQNILYNIVVKVYAFEPDTYLSAGTTELRMILQPW